MRVAASVIFPPAGLAVAEPVVILVDHQVLLVLHPGGTAGVARGVRVGTDSSLGVVAVTEARE